VAGRPEGGDLSVTDTFGQGRKASGLEQTLRGEED
jgi:hypothetical protein